MTVTHHKFKFLLESCFQRLFGVIRHVYFTEYRHFDTRQFDTPTILPALAFAAPNEVPDLLTLVAQQLPMPEASELIHYFEKTYVGRFLPGGTFQAPLFPISMWNYYHETPFGLPRTNNAVEAWHRSFNASVGCQHPNIWRFITSLKREQGLVEFRQAKFTAGARPTKRRKEQNTDRALKELVQSFYYRPRLEFLRQFNLQT